MPIDWKKFETVFRLLAAVHAVLGEDAFKGKFTQIAELFGPEASYDAIKSEWKKVARLGDELWRRHHGQPPGARATQSIFPRRRHRHPRVSIKPETHDIIDLEGNEALREPCRPSVRAKKVPTSNHATRKHKLDTDGVSPEPEAHGRGRNKRVRLDSALNPNIDRDGTNDAVDYHTLPANSVGLFEQIRRAISATPASKANTNNHMVTSASDDVMVPSTIQPMANFQAERLALNNNFSSGWREQSQCQVSTTEHDRRDWDTIQPPVLLVAGTGEVHPQVARVTPEAGPSRIKSDRYPEAYQARYRAPDGISLAGSDEGDRHVGNTDEATHLEASTRPDKGKSRMITPSPRSFNRGSMHPMPSRVSYLNTDHGICYLCSVQFGTVRELYVHERGKYHSHMLTDDVGIEKAQARLEKYGLFERFCSETGTNFMDMPSTGAIRSAQRQARTIIRGPDRAIDVDEEEMDQSSSQDVVEVSQTKPSAYRTLDSGMPRMRKPLANTIKKGKGCISAELSKDKKIVVSDSKQMARILHVNKFSRSGTVDRVLTILECVLYATHTTAPKCLNQFSSQRSTLLSPRSTSTTAACRVSQTRQGPNIWIADAEFASLKGQGNRYDFSVNITNLMSGETLVNHRLELSMPVDELEKKICASRNWQARHQFIIHHRQPCSMPIITPRELARMLKNGGFGPRDFVFVWASSNVDYHVVEDFLAREELQYNLMPPEENVMRVLHAWRELLPKVPCGLHKLFELVFPNSPLRYVHHIADVDTKKLGLMTWKLRDLNYVTHGPKTQLDLCE